MYTKNNKTKPFKTMDGLELKKINIKISQQGEKIYIVRKSRTVTEPFLIIYNLSKKSKDI